jgi:hypothetical protein
MGRVAGDIIKKRIAVVMLVNAAWVTAQEQRVSEAKSEASGAKQDAAGAYGAAQSAAEVASSAVDAAAAADQKAVAAAQAAALAEQKANSAVQAATGAALTNEQQELLLDGLRTTDQNFVTKFNVVEGDLAKFKEETNSDLDNIAANLATQEEFNKTLVNEGYAKNA